MNSSAKWLNTDEIPRIFFAGAAHLDRTGWLDENWQLERSNPGQFEQFFGGAALNVARICQSLYIPTALSSIIGDDLNGNAVKCAAENHGIEIYFQANPSGSTATYTSLIEANGTMVIALADMAIYDDFDAKHALEKMKGKPSPRFLCVDANLPESEILKLVASSPCPVAALTVSAAKAARLKGSLSKLNLLLTNRAEALALCELTGDAPIESALAHLAKKDSMDVVISDGPNGVWLMQDGDVQHIQVPKVETIKDLTGAGDALAGGILTALARGGNLPSAVEFGIRAAQEIIQIPSPFCEDLADLLKVEPFANDF